MFYIFIDVFDQRFLLIIFGVIVFSFFSYNTLFLRNRYFYAYIISSYQFFYILISLIIGWVIVDNYLISINAFIWSFFFLILFLLGSRFVQIPYRKPSFLAKPNFSFLKSIGRFILFSSLLFTLIFFLYYDIGLNVFFDLDELIKVNEFFAFLRYNNPDYPLSTRIFLQIDSTLVYSSSLFGGILFQLAKKNSNKLSSLFFLFPSIIKVTLINAKQVLIASVLLFVVGILLSIMVFPNKSRFRIYNLVPILISGVFFVSLLLITIFLRNSSFDFNQIFITFSNYGFGGYYGFDNFFESFDGTLHFGYGVFNVFYNLYRILIGNLPKEFSDTIVLQDSIWRTNIIMMYGQLISDFGYFGSLFFSFFSGYFFYSAFSNVKRNKFFPFSTIIVAMTLFFYLHSPFGSPWNYLSLINPFLLLYLTLKISTIKIKMNYVQ